MESKDVMLEKTDRHREQKATNETGPESLQN